MIREREILQNAKDRMRHRALKTFRNKKKKFINGGTTQLYATDRGGHHTSLQKGTQGRAGHPNKQQPDIMG